MGSTRCGTAFRQTEIDGSLTSTLEENGRGICLRVISFKRSAIRKFRTIFIPAGDDFGGWGLLGAELRRALEGKNEEIHQTHQRVVPQPMGRRAIETFGQGRTFADMVSGGGSKDKSCRSGAKFKYPTGSTALVELSSDLEVDYLISLPPFSSWERDFCFSKWSKEAGVLSSEEIKDMGKDLTIQVKGIPLHFRIRSVMEEIAKACGHSWKVNDDSLDLVGGIPSISLANYDISKIPRIIYVVESGHRFPVVIEIVDIDKSKQEGVRKETLVRRAPIPVGPTDGPPPSRKPNDIVAVNMEYERPPGFETTEPRMMGRVQSPIQLMNPVTSPNRFDVLQGLNKEIIVGDEI
ncbi:hypothetical protein FRX31_026415 [Thalictrum thalictroides]|uniref:Uncharacterized protein n=1 Tax=Thalictrum thalictroides TaxID=46969 RepID=A0A7J6VHC8_THATH|nr:hypothetical protein FRX31_026415 [Thalictrum thalictroides]